ncbi:MAG TPA: stalk domain-containing protein [Syntrophomonadaceae bacterium]|nr:stalk domain-containing protein [Syntrophomonadaceae bacterium]HPU47925.1 stalk domain-containing protein [Syntrophomonadaceae bacterium]
MKRVLLAVMLCFLVLFTGSAYAMETVEVSVDGKSVSFSDQAAIFDNNKDQVLIPLRAICEALGAQVEWDAGAQKALVTFMNKKVEITINSNRGTLNGKEFALSADAVIMNGRTMVPLDFMQKALGSKATWNADTKSVTILDRNVKIKMASTIGPIDAGIVGTLAEEFEKRTGINVEFLGAGTGKALEMAKSGDYDLVMVHAKALEEAFVAEGYGTKRIPVMYNDFVLMGPASDPAGIKGMTYAEALKAIMDKGAKFISRADQSGTHVKEMELWEAAGLEPKGDWYVAWEGGSKGNSATLKYTNEQQAYTLIDRATYLALKNEISIVPLVEGEEDMLNFISVIPVNPDKFPQVNAKLAQDFIDFMTSDEGQIIIRDFKKDLYGEPMFFPNAEGWQGKN